MGWQTDSAVFIPISLGSLPAFSASHLELLIQPPSNIPSHKFFSIEAQLLQPQLAPYNSSGGSHHVRQSSAFTLLTNAYIKTTRDFPNVFPMDALTFSDSLASWLQTAGVAPNVLQGDMSIAAITSILGAIPPTNVLDSLVKSTVLSVLDYYFDDEDASEIPDSLLQGAFADCPACQTEQCTCDPNPHPPIPARPCSSDPCAWEPIRKCPHKGLDIPTPVGTPVCAPVSGTATVGVQDSGAGIYVKIIDSCGNSWLFMHLDNAIVTDGMVTKGECFGRTGNTGHSTGPHLHIEIRCQNSRSRIDNARRHFGWEPCRPGGKRYPNRAKKKVVRDPVRSGDPNEKAGPQGVALANFLSNQDNLTYIVFCENVDTASAAAQEIILRDTLDLFKVDHRTFELKTITFGNHTVDPPPRSRQFSTTVDLRPQDTLLIVINAVFDTLSGIASWHMLAIDPNTGTPPEDPQKGVLPPNVNSPEGEGSGSFFVMPIDSLPFGTEIRNRASITFDTELPIATGEWLNTIDNLKPQSRVLTLPPVQDSTRFPVFWTGADTGSGIRDYSVYVSVDTGSFFPWLHNTTSTTDLFTGIPGTRYRFYTIARDSVGNLELPKDTADTGTITTGVSIAPEGLPKEYSLSQNFPNPFNPTTTLRYGLPEHSNVTLKIYNILGQEIKTVVDEVQAAGHKAVDWDSRNNYGNQVASGVYFYRLDAKSISGGQTFVRIKKMLLLK